MNRLGVDVATRNVKELIRRLDKLKTTRNVEDGGMYWMDTEFSQVLVDTEWAEDELDNWLYKTKFSPNFEYFGVFAIEGNVS